MKPLVWMTGLFLAAAAQAAEPPAVGIWRGMLDRFFESFGDPPPPGDESPGYKGSAP